MPKRGRPRIVLQFEQKRRREPMDTLAHAAELKLRLMPDFSAEELAALEAKIRGYVAAGTCRATPYRSTESTHG